MHALLMGAAVLAFTAGSFVPRPSIAGDFSRAADVVSGFSRTVSADDGVSGFSGTVSADDVVSGFSGTVSADDGVSGFPGRRSAEREGGSRATAVRDAETTEARASLKNADGDTVGDVTLRETPHGVLMDVQFRSAPSGTRAFHIHETGVCEAPSFESAGDHFAPGDTEHGILNEQGPHAGDLPNLQIPHGGRLAVELFVPDVTLSPGPRSLLDGNGSALVLHADADDYQSDPAGEAGDRIACGVIERSGAEVEARQ